jgi:hypothetical protein
MSKNLTGLFWPKGTVLWDQGLGRTACLGCGWWLNTSPVVFEHPWKGWVCSACYQPSLDVGHYPVVGTFRLALPEVAA